MGPGYLNIPYIDLGRLLSLRNFNSLSAFLEPRDAEPFKYGNNYIFNL